MYVSVFGYYFCALHASGPWSKVLHHQADEENAIPSYSFYFVS